MELVQRLCDVVRALSQDPRRVCETALDHMLAVSGASGGCVADFGEGDLCVRVTRRLREPNRALLAAVRAEARPKIQRNGTALCGLPLKHEDEIVGAALLEDPSNRASFDPQVLELCYLFGGAAAVAIAQSRLKDRLRRECGDLPRLAPGRPGTRTPLLGVSAAMRQIRRDLKRMAAAPYPVLIEGESGTGKELVARLLHELGPRRGNPYVAVNCAGIPSTLMESELFGHARGAFTGAAAERPGLFEQANFGTLFLDEIETMPAAMQEALLRAIETGEIHRVGGGSVRVDVRIVSASNADVAALAHSGRFRQDLYFRLKVLHLRLPPLRERREDIPLLALHFCRKAARESGGRIKEFSMQALERLRAHDWPGNVRELENAVRRAFVSSAGETLTESDFAFLDEAPRRPRAELVSLDEYVRYAVERFGATLSMAELARTLGISRKTLWEKRRKLGLI